jgi:uncharacterized membrane protein
MHSNSNVVTSHRSLSMRDLVARCLMSLVMPHHHAVFLLLIRTIPIVLSYNSLVTWASFALTATVPFVQCLTTD